MQLEGIHHITAITGDAPRNVDFYARVLGLRMVKKTVNQDDPSVYHLFYADELGSAGADLTFFEYPGAVPGRPGPGWCIASSRASASSEALDFWAERLGGEGVATERSGDSLSFSDPEGMAHELVVVDRARPAARRSPPRDPGRARAAGLRGRARLQHAARLDAARARGGAQLRLRRRVGVGGARRRARRPLRARPAARGPRRPGRRHRAPRRLRLDLRGSRGLGRARARARPQPDAGDRPLLLPLDLLPRARRRAHRDRHARARASRPTSRCSRWASISRCRRPSSTCASASSRS